MAVIPIATTSALRMPAIMTDMLNGISTMYSDCQRVMPIPLAASINQA
ncbi:Uncharacterised protein [Mycobacteroides abscessus subsp. abscessus]|nr:Uncharacterised protein [Mycobacteroides abscessus subsp. abscessus]